MIAFAARAQVFAVPQPPNVGIEQKLDNQVPLDLVFADESGKTVALADLVKDKPVVLSLVYYECPMLCGEVLQGMLAAFNKLDFTIGEEFEVVTISFDPREKCDLAALKKQTMLQHYPRPSAASGWHFLTGEEAQIARLAEVVGFGFQFLPATGEYAHGSGIMVLTPQGRVSRYFYGIEYPERDLRLGLVEASDGKIGTLADEILLLCYRYDPASGSYGLYVMRVLRIAGALTVLAIGSLIGGLLWMERRKVRSNDLQKPGSVADPAGHGVVRNDTQVI